MQASASFIRYRFADFSRLPNRISALERAALLSAPAAREAGAASALQRAPGGSARRTLALTAESPRLRALDACSAMASLVDATVASLDAAANGAPMQPRAELQASWPAPGSSGAALSAPASAALPVASGGSAPLLAVSALPAEASRRFDALLEGNELADTRPLRPLGSALAAALAGAARRGPRASLQRLWPPHCARARKIAVAAVEGNERTARRAGAAARRFLGARRVVGARSAWPARFGGRRWRADGAPACIVCSGKR
jgi:hypothetical protein